MLVRKDLQMPYQLVSRYLMCAGEKQAATHVSLDQEYDQDLAAMWCKLEEQLVAAANRGVVPGGFQPTQCYLNSQTDNLRHPLAVVEGRRSSADSAGLLLSPRWFYGCSSQYVCSFLSVSLSAEPIIVELMFRNPLKVPLVLSHLSLLWRFTADDASPSQEKPNEDSSADVITNEETLARGVRHLAT